MKTSQQSAMSSPPYPPDELEESLHALPGWFAWFQKTFGLSFLVIASAYLLGNLATLGWVPDISQPSTWGWFRGAGVILFFVGGVAVAGIGLTCSVVFVASIKRHSWFLVFLTGLGMLLFFGVEVWASLSERSVNILPTPADKAVLTAFAFHGVPPISPTALVVSVLFPLGSLYFGFVQQRRVAVTMRNLEEDALEMERKVRQAEQEARLAEALAHKRAVQARGAVGVIRAATQAARTPEMTGTARTDRPEFPALRATSDVRDEDQWSGASGTASRDAAFDRAFDEFAPVEVYVPRERVRDDSYERVTAVNGTEHSYEPDDAELVGSDDEPPF